MELNYEPERIITSGERFDGSVKVTIVYGAHILIVSHISKHDRVVVCVSSRAAILQVRHGRPLIVMTLLAPKRPHFTYQRL